jgi:hypothetical protein
MDNGLMPGDWHKLKAMSRSEQRLLILAMLLLPGINLALRLFGYQWTHALLSRFIPRTPVQDKLSPDNISHVVRRAAQHGLFRATCLRESLLLWWLLRRRGVTCDIKIGTSWAASRFLAHAWVEWEGGGQSDPPENLKAFNVLKR